jgi:hypothetical protein
VLLAIARCRTAALGGHIDECVRCGHRATISYNSYLNRDLVQFLGTFAYSSSLACR